MPLNAFIPQVENEFVKLRNQIVVEALQLLHFGSPVDQGTYRQNLTENAPFTIVYLQNNLPYGTRLEDGWSQQAGQGVYRTAASALRSKYGGGL